MAKKCALCGGPLKNGICQECGMDNNKTDRQYESRMNHNSCEDAALTHVHGEDQIEKYKKPVLNQTRSASVRTADQTEEKKKRTEFHTHDSEKHKTNLNGRPAGRKKSGLVKMFFLILAATLVINVVSIVFSTLEDFFSGIFSDDEDTEYYEDYEDYDPQEYADDYFSNIEGTYAEAGEVYDTGLEAGLYMIGYDIPEGEYSFDAPAEMEIRLGDPATGMYYSEICNMDTHVDGVRAFNGGVLEVKGGKQIQMHSENAQTGTLMQKAANPLTETYEVSGTVEAGVDFPAGVYDIRAKEGQFVFLNYEVPGEDDYTKSIYGLLCHEFDPEYVNYAECYHNAVFPEGTILYADEEIMTLTPSASIVSEDYGSFYNIY